MEVEHLFLKIYFGFSRLSKLVRLILTTSSHASASSYAYTASLKAPSDSLALPYFMRIIFDLTFFMRGAACLNIFNCRYNTAAFSKFSAFS